MKIYPKYYHNCKKPTSIMIYTNDGNKTQLCESCGWYWSADLLYKNPFKYLYYKIYPPVERQCLRDVLNCKCYEKNDRTIDTVECQR